MIAGQTSEDTSQQPEENHEDYYEEVAYVTSVVMALFTGEDVLLDSQASVSVFCNKNLLSDIGTASKQITLNGVQSGAAGINISEE